MADSFKTLVQQLVPDEPTLLYETPPDKQAVVRQIIVANVSDSDATVTIWVNGIDDQNTILPPTTVVAGGHGEYGGPLTLDTDESIFAQGGTDQAIAISVFGVEGDAG